jgi:Beta-lactamase enzyme family
LTTGRLALATLAVVLFAACTAAAAQARLIEGGNLLSVPSGTSLSTSRGLEATFPSPWALDRARRYAKRRAGLVSFAVVDTSGGSYHYRGRRRYASASVIKAMFLVAYLHRVRAEGRGLTGYERALLAPMIRVSDNDAAAAVYGLLGSARIERLAKAAGMRFFEGIPEHWASGQIAALDQARFFARLEKLVPPRFYRYARRLLRTIVDWQTWGIPAVARPRGYRVFFKTGRRTSPSLSGVIVHQVARLECRGRVFTVAVLTDRQASYGYGIATITGIARRLLARPCSATVARRPSPSAITPRASTTKSTSGPKDGGLNHPGAWPKPPGTWRFDGGRYEPGVSETRRCERRPTRPRAGYAGPLITRICLPAWAPAVAGAAADAQ